MTLRDTLNPIAAHTVANDGISWLMKFDVDVHTLCAFRVVLKSKRAACVVMCVYKTANVDCVTRNVLSHEFLH